MQLKSYLESYQIKAPDFAEMTGLTVDAIYKYMRGERRPEPEPMLKIFQATNGLVDANSFFGIPPAVSHSDVAKLKAQKSKRKHR